MFRFKHQNILLGRNSTRFEVAINPVEGVACAADYLVIEIAIRDALHVDLYCPHRDPVPPPELTANAPVPLLSEPVEVRLRVPLGEELHTAAGHRVHRHL